MAKKPPKKPRKTSAKNATKSDIKKVTKAGTKKATEYAVTQAAAPEKPESPAPRTLRSRKILPELYPPKRVDDENTEEVVVEKSVSEETEAAAPVDEDPTSDASSTEAKRVECR